MEARPRNSAPEESVAPRDRRVPLQVVVFREPTAIPGTKTMIATVEAGATRFGDFVCPQPFLDPVLRSIWIEGREYPLERVHYWERAKMAIKKPEPAPQPTFITGKAAPKK